MTKQHPIAPPPELRKQWIDESYNISLDRHTRIDTDWDAVIDKAAAWGSDQELEACCEWLQDPDLNVDTYKLRACRRPKPPSLAEAARGELDRLIALISSEGALVMAEPIRRALERLQELESND